MSKPRRATMVRKPEVDKEIPISTQGKTKRSRKPSTSNIPDRGSSALGITLTQTVPHYTADAMKAYGTEVVEQRAIPDFRDGLKPVQRMALWSLYKLGIHSTSGFKKSARVVGEIIGKFHPHGDCLRGTTMVPLLNGKTISIKELAESRAGQRWVLAFDEDTGQLVPSLAHSWRIGQTTRTMYRITLSTGEIIEGTSNHPFYVLSKGWVAAKDLVAGQELLGGTLEPTNYPVVSLNTGFRRHVHHIVGDFKFKGIEEGEVYHHKDEDTRNNKPSNLDCITRAEHADLHGDYLEGLNAGRRSMFGPKAKPSLRKAIKKKNSTLLRLHNETLWLRKAVKAINLLTARGKRLTERNYESLRKEIYNLTRLSLLYTRGITFDDLCAIAPKWKMDTSAAIGHTVSTRVPKKLSRRKVREDIPSHILQSYIAQVFRRMYSRGLKHTWSNYLATAKSFDSANFGRTVYTNKEKLQSYFSIETIPELRKVLPGGKLCVIDSVEKIELPTTEEFYDFTVDGLANMIVLTSAGTLTGNFVVAHNSSAYQAMVGIAGTKYQDKSLGKGWASRNCAMPLIEGVGNWGDFVDAAAAYRYTECRLSKFSDLYLLDPDYLAVMDYVPNFDDSEKVPVVLPAKVPVLLLNGFSSIAVGVSGSSAPFALPGVLKLTRKALLGEEVTVKDCVKNLEFDYPYGGVCISEGKELVPVFKGKGSASFMPTYELSEDKRTLTFINVCPGLMSSRSIETFLDKLSNVKGVAAVDDDTNKRGARYVVTFSRTLRGAELDRAIDQCLDLSVRSDSYDIGITIRDSKGNASFKRTSIPEVFKLWAEWRIAVEVKVLNRLIRLQEQHKARQELLLLAVDNLDTIIKALKVTADKAIVRIDKEDREVDASAAFLMKALKISLEDANSILDMKVRQLRAMERSRILSKIKEHVTEIKRLQAYHKAPHTRVIEDLDKMVDIEL